MRRTITTAVAAAAALTLLTGCTDAGVRAEARSEPDVAELAGSLADQRLDWQDCAFGDDPSLLGIDTGNVRCATIEVPRDWHHPDPAKTWDLVLSRAANVHGTAADDGHTLLLHPGGPTEPGLPQAAISQAGSPDLRASTNFVSFDQRGIGRSSHPTCEYDWDPGNTDSVAELRTIAAACADDPDVRTVTTEQTAYDMDFIRHLLGLRSVSFLGYSYGSWLGTWFGALFPEHVDRMVLDSSIDTTGPSIQANFDAQNRARDRQFRLRLLNWIARHDDRYGLGDDPEAIADRYFAATSAPNRSDAAGLLWNATSATVALGKNQGYPEAAALIRQLVDEGEAATRGATDPAADSGAADPGAADPGAADPAATIAARVLDRYDPADFNPGYVDRAKATLAVLTAPREGTPGQVRTETYDLALDFTRCTDGQWRQGEASWQRFNAAQRGRYPLSAQLGILDDPPICAFWPTTDAMPEIGDDFPETIVVQSELDTQTPLESGRAAGTKLPNTSLIAVDDEGEHGVFPYGTDDVDGPVTAFLRGGDRPAPITVVDALPLPDETEVYETWSPLDDDARHGGHEPEYTDPWRTAPAATPSAR